MGDPLFNPGRFVNIGIFSVNIESRGVSSAGVLYAIEPQHFLATLKNVQNKIVCEKEKFSHFLMITNQEYG